MMLGSLCRRSPRTTGTRRLYVVCNLTECTIVQENMKCDAGLRCFTIHRTKKVSAQSGKFISPPRRSNLQMGSFQSRSNFIELFMRFKSKKKLLPPARVACKLLKRM